MSSASLLYGADNRPLRMSGAGAYGSYGISRITGGLSGTLSNWLVSRNNQYPERPERETTCDRAVITFTLERTCGPVQVEMIYVERTETKGLACCVDPFNYLTTLLTGACLQVTLGHLDIELIL